MAIFLRISTKTNELLASIYCAVGDPADSSTVVGTSTISGILLLRVSLLLLMSVIFLLSLLLLLYLQKYRSPQHHVRTLLALEMIAATGKILRTSSMSTVAGPPESDRRKDGREATFSRDTSNRSRNSQQIHWQQRFPGVPTVFVVLFLLSFLLLLAFLLLWVVMLLLSCLLLLVASVTCCFWHPCFS